MSIVDSIVGHCVSIEDGGFMRLVNGASLTVSRSLFKESASKGHGGGISVVGAIVDIRESSFERCYSAGEGGALWASQFLRYPNVPLNSSV
ncbi:MAG: hypothetical protein ACPIOQ_00285, partial [Promethearchaeia archaeon]